MTLRAGIAGFGLAGEVFHGPLIAATPGIEVAGIVTGDPERAAKARAKHPGAKVVASVEELWTEIDLLVVAAPNRFHSDLALQAIDQDVAVVIDKPMAATVEGAELVVAAGGRVTVFQNRRWDGDFLTLKRLIEDGRIGEVIRFESSFERFRPVVGDRWRDSGDPSDGGGQLADLGSHLIDQAIVLFGLPERVYAEVDRRRSGSETDDDVFIALEHAGGIRSHLHMGVLAPLAGNRFRVSGLKGGLSINGLDPQEAQLKAGALPGSDGFGQRDDGFLITGPAEEVEPVRALPGRYVDFYGGVVTWLKDGQPPPVDSLDSLQVLKVIEAARASSARHEVADFRGP